MKSIVSLDSPLVSPPADFDGDFFKGTVTYKMVNSPDFKSREPYNLPMLFCAEIRNGLIGVGLINVEDRSGVLSLDKGEVFKDLLDVAVRVDLYCVS